MLKPRNDARLSPCEAFWQKHNGFLCEKPILPYEHSAFATGLMLYIGYKNINVSIKNDKIKESEHRVYELSWCRWPGSNRHGIATTGF